MYHVCLVAPSRSQLIFAELAILLNAALLSAGKRVSFAFNELKPGAANIVLAYQLLDHLPGWQEHRIIPYQLEQLSDQVGRYTEKAARVLASAWEVWDYSLENVEFLRQKGIAAKHLPVGHHPALARINPAPKKDIDVLFYGALNPRREQALTSLQGAGLAVTALTGQVMEERDEYIARARLVLNVHYYPMEILEVVRISYLLNNEVPVLSENSALNPYQEVGLPMAPYEKLTEAALALLADPEGLAQTGRECGRRFARLFPMGRFVHRVTADHGPRLAEPFCGA